MNTWPIFGSRDCGGFSRKPKLNMMPMIVVTFYIDSNYTLAICNLCVVSRKIRRLVRNRCTTTIKCFHHESLQPNIGYYVLGLYVNVA